MNRDETIALFLKGKEAWNAWAEKMLAEQKALKDRRLWKEGRDTYGAIIAANKETQAWVEAASTIFSSCHFLVRGVEGIKQAAGDERKKGGEEESPVKSISID